MVLVTPRIVDPVQQNSPPPLPPANPIKFLEFPKFDKGLPAAAPTTQPQQPGAK